MTTADLANTTANLTHGSIWEALREAVDSTNYRPTRRDGLVWRQLTTAHGEEYVIIQNPQAATYLRLPPEDFFVFELMDGSMSIRDLVVAYMLRFHKFALPRVARLVQDLRYNHFLVDPPYFTYQQVRRRAQGRTLGKFLDTYFGVIFNREFPISGIDGALQRAYRAAVWALFTRPALILATLIAISGVPLFIYYLLSQHYSLLLSDSIAQDIVAYYISFLVIAVVHELSHAFTVKAYGRVVRRGGFAIFYGLPGMFVDTQDIWMEPRGPRIAASWAGPFSGLVLTGLVGLALTFVPNASWTPGLRLFGIAALVNNLFQLMPLIQLDGYFILMDWLELPQLRRRALAFVRHDLLAKIRRRTAFNREERIFTIFGVLAAVYTTYAITLASVFWWKHASDAIQSALRVPNLASLLGLVVLLLILIPFVLGLMRRVLALLQTGLRSARRATGMARERFYRQRAAILLQTPALTVLGNEQAQLVARHLREERFDPDSAVVRQGDPGERFYLIASGQAEVIRETAEGSEVLATLGPLDYFGERALLENVPRTATVRAQSKMRAFSLSGADFRRSVAPYVGADAGLRARLEERAELDEFPLFESLSSREKDLLLSRFRTEIFQPGQVVLRENDPHGDFYCIRAGEVTVTRHVDGGEVQLDRVGPGSFFGEVALLLNAPRNATIIATQTTHLWALSPADFHELLGHYFNLESTLAEAARERLRPGEVLLDLAPRGAAAPVDIGQLAADFRLETVDGGMCELAELRGKPVLVWFSRGWSDPASREYATSLDAVESDRVLIQVSPDSVNETRRLQPEGIRHVVVCDPAKLVYLQYDLYTPRSDGAPDVRPATWWDALRQHVVPGIGDIREGVVLIDELGSMTDRYVASPTTPLPDPKALLGKATTEVA